MVAKTPGQRDNQPEVFRSAAGAVSRQRDANPRVIPNVNDRLCVCIRISGKGRRPTRQVWRLIRRKGHATDQRKEKRPDSQRTFPNGHYPR